MKYTKKTHIFKLCMLLVGILALRPDDVQASHFRYGNVTWERVAGQPNQVRFRITQAWRRSYPVFNSPNVGSVVNTGNFNAGNGTVPISLTVTSINIAEDWVYGEYTFVRTYAAGTTNFTAFFQDCCRVSNLLNNNDRDFRVSTNVTLGNNNDAPVASVPPFINLPVGSTAATYQIPATDPNGDALTFSLVPNGQFGAGTVQPTGISITNSGLLSFNTVGKTVGSLWNTAVYVTDSKGAQIQLDLMIRIATASTPPVFDYTVTPANNTTYVLTPGQPVTFNVKASDVDAGDNVTLSAVGLPVGSSFTTGSGNPVNRSFSWTPTTSNLGTFQVNFIAQDNASIQNSTIVNIAVSTKPNFVAPSILSGSILCNKPGDTIRQQYYASDVDTADRIVLSLVTPLQAGMSFSPSLPTAQANPASANFTWVTSAANWGINKVIVRATDKYSEMRDDTVTYIVNTPPEFATTQNNTTVIAGQPFSYTFSGTDADITLGDNIILSHTHIPSWLTITDNQNGTWTLSGTPSIADAGINDVTLNIQDLTNHYNGTHCGQATQNFEINVLPCNITTSTSITNVQCYGTNTGAIDLTVNNATAPVTYTWSNSATTQDLNAVIAGAYSVAITDANGCTASATATITQATAPLSNIVTTTNPDCATPNGGSATVSGVTGGITPYQYSVGSGAYGSSNVLGGLAPGVYQINVKDAAGCVLSKSVSIIKPFCSVAANDNIVNCGGNTFNIPLSQLLTNDMIAAGDTIAIGDWSTNATGGGTVTYNSSTKVFTYTPPTQGFNGNVSFNYTIKRNDNTVAFSGNGHFYEFKPGSITWTNAKNAASSLFYNGMQGYLATVTSAAENAFINTKLQANGWMGASDLASEGTWRWVTGPEGLENGGLGRHFTNQNKNPYYYGNCSAGTGSAVNGNYINWQGGEPNDCGANLGQFYSSDPIRPGEHVAHFYAGSGTWNDFPDNAGVDGYVVEYGGLEVIAPVTLTSTATVFINNAKVVSSSTPTAPLCPGASNGTITVLATGGTAPYQYSKDNGNTYQSSNSFAGLTAGNYAIKVKDANGCTAAHTANVAAGVDNTIPTINCPSDITVNATTGLCGAAVTFPAATGTDNCTAPGALVFTYSKNSGSVFPVGTTTVTVTAKDAWNNISAPCMFTVTVLDVEAPIITLPANATVSCDGSTSTTVNGTATATDNCGSATVSYTDASTQDADANSIGHYNYVVTRTWKAIDAKGNSATADQTITVHDVTNPTIEVPANATVNCQDATTTEALGEATGEDNCSPVTISFTDVNTQDANVNNAGHYNYTITRTWKAMDVTGNAVTANQTITVQDVTNPSIEIPANATVNCQDATTTEALGLATGSDNCGPVAITYNDASSQDANANNAGHYNYTITRTWKVTDVTGNFITAAQTITVQDVTNPVVVVPSNTTVSCDGSVATAENGEATGSDNCGPVAITYTDASNQDANVNNVGHYNYTITRTWKATDVTGNYVTGNQTITVQDVTAPTISCPANTYASCKTTTEHNGTATGSDNCAPVTITYTDASTKSGNATNASYYDYTITRTWKATDVTGNFTTSNQLINVSELRGAAIAVTPVNTINNNHPNYTIYLGYGPQSVTLDATVSGGIGNRTYSWSPSTGVANPNAATTSVAPTTTTTYTVTITDATGCTTQKSVTIYVIDVRCGNKVQICHFPPGNPGNAQQQCLPASAIAAHLAHGCKLGVCPQAKFNESGEDDHNIDNVVVNEVKVYPNPTTGVFTIELPTGMENADVVIMDMTGKIIDRKAAIQGNRLQFDLSDVARGAYMVQTTSGINVYRSRIVLQ